MKIPRPFSICSVSGHSRLATRRRGPLVGARRFQGNGAGGVALTIQGSRGEPRKPSRGEGCESTSPAQEFPNVGRIVGAVSGVRRSSQRSRPKAALS
jgi:hypothetical protein